MKRSFHETGLGSPSVSGTEASLGDIPIKTKSRACSECKKHKIKCQIDADQQKCRRCLRQNLHCVTDNTLQKFVDGDTRWKAASSLKTARLENAVERVLQQLSLPALESFDTDNMTINNNSSNLNNSNIINNGSNLNNSNIINNNNGSNNMNTEFRDANMSQDASAEIRAIVPTIVNTSQYGTLDPSSIDVTREPSHEPDFGESPGRVVSAPTEALYEVTKLRNLRNDYLGAARPKSNLLELDLISRGILPQNEAEILFDSFNHHMNQLLWGGIIMKHPDLESVRRSSSLLSAAILTVASIHIPNRSGALEKCYDEYLSLVSRSVFRRGCTLDDIRALCIGAFWLPDLSWRLSRHAISLATEMGLQHSYRKMMRGDTAFYDRAQLWFLVYVCDHQFATTYGRPPTIYEDLAITEYESYLRFPCTGAGDVRLMAQVALFVIHTHIHHHFGTDDDSPILEEEFSEIRRYNLELDKWRAIWQSRAPNNQYVHTYPGKGVVLHHYFAKFQLNALAFRAIDPQTCESLTTARKESANIAVQSAMSVLAFILDEPDVRCNMVGIPLFTHTMLAFSAVFLLKVTLTWSSDLGRGRVRRASAGLRVKGIYINPESIEDLVDRVILLLRNSVASEKHLIHHIASGLSKMLASFKISMRGGSEAVVENNQQSVMQPYTGQQAFQNITPTSGLPGSAANFGEEGMVDDFGFSFNEIWQNFPAMTMDFLTSQWQDNELGI